MQMDKDIVMGMDINVVDIVLGMDIQLWDGYAVTDIVMDGYDRCRCGQRQGQRQEVMSQS